MDVARAIFRLLVAAAIGWLAFWGWRYVGCIHAQGAIFFCPNASGKSLVRTDGLRMASICCCRRWLGWRCHTGSGAASAWPATSDYFSSDAAAPLTISMSCWRVWTSA